MERPFLDIGKCGGKISWGNFSGEFWFGGSRLAGRTGFVYFKNYRTIQCHNISLSISFFLPFFLSWQIPENDGINRRRCVYQSEG